MPGSTYGAVSGFSIKPYRALFGDLVLADQALISVARLALFGGDVYVLGILSDQPEALLADFAVEL
jgi:hypothetical protein